MIREKENRTQNRSVGDLYIHSVDSKQGNHYNNYNHGHDRASVDSGSTSSASSPPSSPVWSSGGRGEYTPNPPSPSEELDGFPSQVNFCYPNRCKFDATQ
jgi:hypothetical protein